MEKNLLNYHHNSYSIAITWLRAARVDGHISIHTSLKMGILSLKTVLHTSTQLLAQNALNSNTVQLWPKLRNLMMSVVPMVSHQRNRWWRRSSETVFSIQSSKLQQFSQPTRKALLLQKASNNFMLSHKPKQKAKKLTISLMRLSLPVVSLGRNSITQLCF